jgi:hypothetical protein
MPVSNEEGKAWSKERILDIRPTEIWDFGAGSGTYSDLLRTELPNTQFVAVEIFEPYVEMFDLKSKYDLVVVQDARTLDFSFLTVQPNNMAIFGDVLEHMHESEARDLIEKAKGVFEYILVSVPIIDIPQGEVHGNLYETHHKTWSFSEMHYLMDSCEAYEGDVLGVYLWNHTRDPYVDIEEYWEYEDEYDPDDICGCGCDDDYFGDYDD